MVTEEIKVKQDLIEAFDMKTFCVTLLVFPYTLRLCCNAEVTILVMPNLDDYILFLNVYHNNILHKCRRPSGASMNNSYAFEVEKYVWRGAVASVECMCMQPESQSQAVV